MTIPRPISPTQDLPLTDKQAVLLSRLWSAVEQANTTFDAAVGAIIAGHDVDALGVNGVMTENGVKVLRVFVAPGEPTGNVGASS